MKKAHPRLYLPDLAPSVFFLFGYAKRNLMEYRAENFSELLVRIQVILKVILAETFVEIFLEWMKRLQRYIHMNGEFVG
jgi:hypothetical protein